MNQRGIIPFIELIVVLTVLSVAGLFIFKAKNSPFDREPFPTSQLKNNNNFKLSFTRDDGLWLLEGKQNKEEKLFDIEDKSYVTNYGWTPDGKYLVYTTDHRVWNSALSV